mmetsp:Transcript_13163/g.41483  ORF Transcript_13163/g.41483 Transcript_13163/m.41483 type:complete len:122 (+) Transcript_13163:99-464(+)
MVKAHQLRKKSREQLLEQLEEKKLELLNLRFSKVSGAAGSKLGKIRPTRKDIARILTVVNQTARDEQKAKYAGKKNIPIDLRPKFSRKLRRMLTKREQGQKTWRASRKQYRFPKRKYAVIF